MGRLQRALPVRDKDRQVDRTKQQARMAGFILFRMGKTDQRLRPLFHVRQLTKLTRR